MKQKTAESKRLEEARSGKADWRRWGPYLSERQWGTVREDYSKAGNAWEFFPHDHARSRTYRWGEDGIAGISDSKQLLCFAIALWNGRDPILKERLFGLTGSEGNHGEDVKEYYFYLDNLPTHSYMKYLYKYPQSAYPYEELVEENKRRDRFAFEYELLDTGVFDEDRYFDLFVEYAKNTPEELFIQITAYNRGPDRAVLDLLPTLWLRNTWSWEEGKSRPELRGEAETIKCSCDALGARWLYCNSPDRLLFTDNETNRKRLFGTDNKTPYVKDAFHEYIVHGNNEAVNPKLCGTKSAAHYHLEIPPGDKAVVQLRLSDRAGLKKPFGREFSALFTKRAAEAEAFYRDVTPFPLPDDMRNVQRQAFAGLLWNKQLYHYNVRRWQEGDPTNPTPPQERKEGRNARWWHLDAYDIFSMPDKWEYPWFAAWDLAFHTLSLALIDPDFAKEQLLLLTREWYMHPDGQVPAYEWAFGDVNPPVHAWAAMHVFQIETTLYGRRDEEFLKRIFHKLSLNFTWWVNRKDAEGHNIFEGGFLGLDNIGAFDRSKGLPGGGILEQSDGTGWMGMYCLNLMQIALELATTDPAFGDMATKFFEHFIYIADAINNIGEGAEGLWDEEQGYYYGLLKMPDGRKIKLNQDTIAGLVPLFAVVASNPTHKDAFPGYRKRFQWMVDHRPDLLKQVVQTEQLQKEGRVLLALASPERVRLILRKVLDETQFLSPYGIRSISQKMGEHPYVLRLDGQEYRLNYEPAESTTALFGGNSNWRGPIWFPLNYLLIESLQRYHYYLGDAFTVECPTGSHKECSLWEVSTELTHRLIQIFLKDEKGHRPVYGGIEKFQNDPHWRDYILFHEYFHGDHGAGLGASAQTGWTALVAKLIQQYGEYALQHKSPL